MSNLRSLSYDSHLFLLRLWQEDLGDDHYEWRGSVRHILGAETRYFRHWPALVEHLKEMLPEEAIGDGQSETDEWDNVHDVER